MKFLRLTNLDLIILLNRDIVATRDGRPAPRGTLPAGRGGVPRPAPPAKMIRSAGKWRGKKKVTFSNLSKRGK